MHQGLQSLTIIIMFNIMSIEFVDELWWLDRLMSILDILIVAYISLAYSHICGWNFHWHCLWYWPMLGCRLNQTNRFHMCSSSNWWQQCIRSSSQYQSLPERNIFLIITYCIFWLVLKENSIGWFFLSALLVTHFMWRIFISSPLPQI